MQSSSSDKAQRRSTRTRKKPLRIDQPRLSDLPKANGEGDKLEVSLGEQVVKDGAELNLAGKHLVCNGSLASSFVAYFGDPAPRNTAFCCSRPGI